MKKTNQVFWCMNRTPGKFNPRSPKVLPTKTVRISKPLHSLVKKHVSKTGMKLEKYIEWAVTNALTESEMQKKGAA